MIPVYSPTSYAANIGTTVFAIPWAYQSTSHVKPYLDGVLLTTGFTVSAAGPSGTVTFGVAPVGTTITFLRELPMDQPVDFQNQGSFSGKRHEDEYDRLVMQVAQVSEKGDRAVIAKVGSSGVVLPSPESNKVLGWIGNDLVNVQSIPTGSVSGAMVPVVTAPTLDQARTAFGGIVAVVDTIADMKALTAPIGAQTYLVRGYYAPDDGGGGHFRWNSADTTTDNGGTVIQPNAGGVGRWNLLAEDTVNVRDFGAKGDGVADDTAAIQAALNTGKDVVFTNGTFICGSVTASTANQKITGFKATLKHRPGAVLPFVLKIAASGVLVRNLTFDGNASNVTGSWTFSESCIFIDQSGVNFWLIENTFFNWKSLSVFMNGGVPGNANVAGFMCRGNLFNLNLEIALYLWIGPQACEIIGNRFVEQYKGAIRLYDAYAKKVVISSNIVEYTSGAALTGQPLAIEVNSLTAYSVAAEGAGEHVIVNGNVVIGSLAGGAPLWGISLDGCARFIVSNNSIRTGLLWGIEIVRGYGVVTGNVVQNVTGPAASSAAGVILNSADGTCVVSNNVIKDVTLNAGILVFGTTNYCHVIASNTLENCKFQIISNHSGTINVQGNVFLGGANTSVPATVITCATQQDEVNFSNNACLFKNAGYGFVQSIIGDRWLVHGNRFEGGGVVAACLTVPATYSRSSIQGNRIRNYNAKCIDTSASAGKNVIGGNSFESFGAASTYAGTDTAFNNVDIT